MKRPRVLMVGLGANRLADMLQSRSAIMAASGMDLLALPADTELSITAKGKDISICMHKIGDDKRELMRWPGSVQLFLCNEPRPARKRKLQP